MTLLEHYRANSQIICSNEELNLGKFSITSHDLFFAEKITDLEKSSF